MATKTLWLRLLLTAALVCASSVEIARAAPVSSSSASSEAVCNRCGTVGADPNVVTVDARNGSIQGKKRFGKQDSVKVILINKNPYLFTYQVIKTETPVDEKALATFLAALSPLFKPDNGTPKAGTETLSSVSPPAGPGPEVTETPHCPAQPEALALEGQIQSLMSTLDEVRENARQLTSENQHVEEVLSTQLENRRTGLKNDQADCQRLCKITNDVALDSRFMGFPPEEPSKVGESLKQIPTLARALRQLANDYEARFHPASSCRVAADARQAADEAESRLQADLMAVAKSADLAKKAKSWQEAIQQALSDPTSFEGQVTLGDYDRTTDGVVKVTRLSVDAGKDVKPTDLATVSLRFGKGPFFALSGGVAYSNISKPQFQPTQGFARNRDGSLIQPEVSTKVIGTSENANPVTPLLMLNGRLWQWSEASLHLSLGITAKNTDGSTDVEYLVGGSFSLLEDHLFITLGVYGWKSQRLQGDQYVGQAIGDSVTTLAVTKQSHWKPGFALTYRIR
jgi:hypothetical protein